MSRLRTERLCWVGHHRSYGFIDDIYTNLIGWTEKVLVQFNEVPFGYTEWTLAGHVAMAADRAKMFALQDYLAEHKDPNGKAAVRKKRPDLYVKTRSQDKGERDCVFEMKSCNVPIEKGRYEKVIAKSLSDTLRTDWDKVRGYGAEEGEFCCALVGLPVYAHIGTWADYGKTPQNYDDACDSMYGFLRSRLKRASQALKSPPNFCGGYFLRHQYARDEMKWSKQQGWEPVAVGMLWVGKIGKSS